MKRITDGKSRALLNVKNKTLIHEDERLVFSFANFHFEPINIHGEFNNFYQSEEQYIEKISAFVAKALPLLSNEKVTLFSKEYSKADKIHLHKASGKKEIIATILEKYKFSQDAINNLLEGDDIYQLEIPYLNGSNRIFFQRIDNIISFLFVDPNHHVYFNPQKVKESGSLYYEYCPIYAKQVCTRMDDLGTCYAFEYLDEEKYKASYEYDFNPVK